MKLDICFSSDNSYSKYMATTIASILSNSKEDEELYFHILDCGITEENKNRIYELKSIKQFNIIFYNTNENKYNLPHYLRLNIASIIKDIDRVLYLDCDTIVLNSLAEIFSIDINNYYAIVCEDVYLNRIFKFKEMHGLNKDEIYFNSGVMMINLKLWRENNLEEIFYNDYLKFGNTGHADQDILNRIIKNHIKVIDSKWNFLSHKKVYNEPLKEINIIHYAAAKPWKKDVSNVFFVEEFWKYYQYTPWYKINSLETINTIIEQKFHDYEQIKLNINRIRFLGIYKNKDKIEIVIFFIKITIELNLDNINRMAWWIPIKKVRDNLRKSILQ